MKTVSTSSFMVAALLALSACSEDDEADRGDDDRKPTRASAASGEEAPPLYALMYEVFNPDGSDSYLSVLDSLDVDEIDSAEAREYPGGRAFMQVYDGKLFVGEPTAPIVHRYAVSDSGELEEEGSISFANYGLTAGEIDPWGLTFVSSTKAYLFDAKEGTHIVWNPETLDILGEIEPPEEFLRTGWDTGSTPAVVRDGRLYRVVTWSNPDTARDSEDYLLAIYDVENDELIETVKETRCLAPGNLVHRDEQDNLYFSNWIWPIAGTLMNGAASSCVLRIPAGSDHFDPDWELSFPELTGGHEGGMFTYLNDGKALVSVFDETLSEFDATTDPYDLAGRQQWSIWSVDVETKKGERIESIPLNAGAYSPAVFDDRTFVIVPDASWESQKLYELVDGSAEPGFVIPGWSYAFSQLR